MLVFGVCCVLWGIFVERRRYRLVRHRLDILPATAAGPLTVLHLSDLHFVRRDAGKAAFLAALPAADVTVVTGDFLAEPEAVETTVAAVRAVRGRLASWFVLGSNDYFVPRPLNYLAYFRGKRKPRRAERGRAGDLVSQLRADGWDDLTNVRRDVDVNGLPIELLGLDDAHIAWHDLRVAPRRSPERFGFAVMHSPDSAPETAALGLRPDGRRPHARRPGVPAGRRSLGDELLAPGAVGERHDPRGRRRHERVARPRDEQVRAVPVLLPP